MTGAVATQSTASCLCLNVIEMNVLNVFECMFLKSTCSCDGAWGRPERRGQCGRAWVEERGEQAVAVVAVCGR